MATQSFKYCEYFDVDERYFPCIDESAINSGVSWEATYPHETFVELVEKAEKMLSGTTNRALWIHGSYGTGKSRCAYTLKKLLEVPEDELRAYWNKFDSLKKRPVLLEKLIGHRNQGVVVAFRYSAGSILKPQQLFFAIQESIQKALDENQIPYKGENSLKESVIAWLQDETHARFMDDLLRNKPKWMSTFSQSSSEEIINALKKGGDVSSLMDNIFALASEEGITALDLTADSLRDWITDVIEQNHIKIVLLWDEFSDYFRHNDTSLGEFQKIVSICQEKPFYFIIVTHPLSSISVHFGGSNEKTNPWSVVQQRFDKVEIALPNNIAFDLIASALNVKEAAKSQWNTITSDLFARLPGASRAVMKATDIKDENAMRNILPIHPMAALVLKNIASSYGSNQRSMFDFIKTPKDMTVKAFQWFIHNTAPDSDRPLLTVDMLWDFFYENGKDDLSSDVRLILDTFSQHTQLNEREQIVLKTILILQAVNQRLHGSLPLLKPTVKNLKFVFEGDSTDLESPCTGIATSLVNKGVLIEEPTEDHSKIYSAAVLAGDGTKIESYRKEIREKQGTTADLAAAAETLGTALNLTPPLKLRYALDPDEGNLPVVTESNFKKTMENLKNKDAGWHFYAVLAVAKTEAEAMRFRTQIEKTVADPAYQNITVIDALSSPLGLESFTHYVEYSAMSRYYSGNSEQQAKENAKKAKDVLQREWKDRIHDGQFIVFSYANQEGERAMGASAVHTILKTIVLKRYRHVQDFTDGLTESQLKITTPKPVAKYGIDAGEVKGLIKGCETKVLGKFWNKPEYWKDEALANEHIVIIKKSVDKVIKDAFERDGKISIGEICDHLETVFGFSRCNLSVFITGFLLKEYSSDPYRAMDAEGHPDSMTPDKLAEMIANYVGKPNSKTTYIVSLTEEEKAFYKLTEKAWGIPVNSCSSPQQAGAMVLSKMRGLCYPVWCLEDVDTTGAYELVKLYIRLVRDKGDEAHSVAKEIGKIAIQRPSVAEHLRALLTPEKCAEGMHLFLERFENGRLLEVAHEIGADNNVLSDTKDLFSVQYSALWDSSTGEDEIRKLITEYEVVKVTNDLLNVSVHSLDDAFAKWRERLKFISFSCESITQKEPALGKFFSCLLRIAKREDLLPEHLKSFLDESTEHLHEIREILDGQLAVFMNLYAPYLKDFNESECEQIKASITIEMFTASSTASNTAVKKAAEDFRKNQVKTQLFQLWKEKTEGTKNPRDWSERYRTPILCCIPDDQYTAAKDAFSTLNSEMQTETEIAHALEYLKNADFFEALSSPEHRNQCFAKRIIGGYSDLLNDVNAVRDSLEATGIAPYEWIDNPVVRQRVSEMASAEYAAGGSDKAISVIESMDEAQLKKWLIDIARKDMDLGVRIIINGEN